MSVASEDSMAPATRIRFFSLRGRIGRVRYIAHALGAIACAFVLMLAAGYGLPLSGSLGRMIYTLLAVALFYGVLPLFFVLLTMRRAHDFNFGGWLALLLLVPFVGLVFCVIPGTRGDNNYGAQPEAASPATRLIAILLFLLLLGGFLATLANRDRQANAPVSSSPSTSLKPYTP